MFHLREGNEHPQSNCEKIHVDAMSQLTDEAEERTGSLAGYKPLKHPRSREGAEVSEHERVLPQQMESIFKVY